MNIQKADITDFDKIKVISDELRQIHIEGRPDLFKNITIFDMEFFETFFGENVCYIVKENDDILGYTLLKVTTTKADAHMTKRKVAFVEEIAVKKGYRGKGIGSMLLSKVEEHAKEANANVIDFRVFDFNENAKKFYSKHGYKVRAFEMEKWII